jgi:DNA-binding protein HU-beta
MHFRDTSFSCSYAFVITPDCRMRSLILHSTPKKTEVESFKKADFIASISATTGMTKKDSELALMTFTDIVVEQIAQGKKVALPGFGTFTLKERAERNGRNPLTGEPLVIPPSKTPSFKASKTWKDKVNSSESLKN